MRPRLMAMVLALASSTALGQSSDVLGQHDLSMGGNSHIKGQMSAACV